MNIGFFGSSAIVLLSDGENTTRPDPLALAEVASTAGVHVHAIGVGTEQGTVVQIDGFSVATALDADMLKKIADITDGTYHQASDAAALTGIYKSIDLEFKRVKKPREVTALFAAAGGLLLALGSALSIALVRAGGLRCRSPGRSRSCRCSSFPRSSGCTGGACGAGASRPFATRASRSCARCCRSGSAGSGTFRSPCCSPASSRSGSPPAGRTSCASVPIARTSIILALDVSRSMCSTDVEPNRLAVAQEAARAFVENQPKGVRMGLVVFSGFAELAVPPTTDRKALVDAIDGLTTGHGTAIGSAMLKGLDAIAEANPNVAPVGDAPETEPPASGSTPSSPPVNGFVPDIVVLLTDGANNRGIEPLDAVPYAVERRVRVYPIGFGTANPSPPSCTREQLGGDVFDAGGFGGGGGGFGGFGGRPRVPRRRRADAEGGRQADRRHLPRRQGRRSAEQGVRRPPEGGRDAEAADRDHLDARGARRPPRGRGGRGLDALEPVPVSSGTGGSR